MIEATDLRKRYGSKEVLRGVSFSLAVGVTGLLGPNGAGKTTLLRCLLGLVRPNSGRVVMTDATVTPRTAVGYLPQRYGLLRELTVNESLVYYAALKNIRREDVQAQIEEVLSAVNLLDQQGVRVGSLSGGMIRRVGIAAALLGNPAVLVFDEPTAGLDPEERVRFKRLVSQLARTRAVLISTHIVEDIEALGSKVIVLDEGAVQLEGTPEELAACARGRCFVVPESQVNARSTDYYVERFFEQDGGSFARVLAKRARPGFAAVTPTVEDGYLCLTQGIV